MYGMGKVKSIRTMKKIIKPANLDWTEFDRKFLYCSLHWQFFYSISAVTRLKLVTWSLLHLIFGLHFISSISTFLYLLNAFTLTAKIMDYLLYTFTLSVPVSCSLQTSFHLFLSSNLITWNNARVYLFISVLKVINMCWKPTCSKCSTDKKGAVAIMFCLYFLLFVFSTSCWILI